MASLAHFDRLQDADAVVRFGFVWLEESMHSQHKDKSRRVQAQLGQTRRAPAGQKSKVAREPRQ